MGNVCCSCCSKRERSVEDLLDGSLEDKLLGKSEDDVEVTTAEEEAWRQRREQLKDEEDMSMKSLDGDDDGNGTLANDDQDGDMTSLIWNLSDRNMVHKQEDSVEDDEDFGSAKEDDDDQETKEHVEGVDIDRLSRLSARSADDSYTSMHESYSEESSRVFRDTELDSATEMDDTFLSVRDDVANKSFLVDDDDDVQQQENQQKEEHDDDQAEEENSADKPRSDSNSSSRRRTGKKKSRSRKSTRK